MKLDIKTNGKDIQAHLSKFAADVDKVAIVRALNKAAAQAKTEASKAVRAAGYNIKASAIKKSFTIKRATQANMEVRLKATGKPITLINYGARQTKSGVTVTVKGGRTILRHAFIAKMGNGHTGVFERIGAARLGKKVMINGKLRRPNTPIEEKYGPSIPDSLANTAVNKVLMKRIQDALPRLLAHEVEFIAMKK